MAEMAIFARGVVALGSPQAGGGSISALRVTGDPAKGDPERGGPPAPPPTPLIYWGDLSVSGWGPPTRHSAQGREHRF